MIKVVIFSRIMLRIMTRFLLAGLIIKQSDNFIFISQK